MFSLPPPLSWFKDCLWSSDFLTFCLIKPLTIPCLPPFPTNFYNGLLCSHKLNISPVLQHVVPRFDYKHRRTSSWFGPAVSFISCSPALHLEEAGSCCAFCWLCFYRLSPRTSAFCLHLFVFCMESIPCLWSSQLPQSVPSLSLAVVMVAWYFCLVFNEVRTTSSILGVDAACTQWCILFLHSDSAVKTKWFGAFQQKCSKLHIFSNSWYLKIF